ncbi:hypothetical protein DBR46_13720 [Pseudomonas sp. KBW05]|nr:hypothetical protein DBR46_13720 [Pseudomonas sp. KBW05]
MKWLFCGSWLACDAGTSVYQLGRGDAIAGKPAPTGGDVLAEAVGKCLNSQMFLFQHQRL